MTKFFLTKTGNVFFIFAILFSLKVAAVKAHEISPSILDLSISSNVVQLKLRLSVEAILADVNLSETDNTNFSQNSFKYDELRSLNPEEIKNYFSNRWSDLAPLIQVNQSGRALELNFSELSVPEIGNLELTRISHLYIEAELKTKDPISFSWDPKFGPVVVRQMGVQNGITQFLQNGDKSDLIYFNDNVQYTKLNAFLDYIPVGFEHIIPKGWDHIIFVLGLFFFSTKLRPLVWQISAFTVAHTFTLALGSIGYIKIIPEIVEPLIALSIVFIAVENIFFDRLSKWRPIVIFIFGLLHGLGFASVLGEFGLPDGFFITALLGFNLGVEIGQLTVVLLAFITLGYWFNKKDYYQISIANPISIIIGLVGAYWFIERVI